MTPINPPHRASFWREPLLHFLLIGAALFALYGLLNRGESDAPREIVVSEARVAALAENFAKTWMRPPTAEELSGLVEDYVREEIYYREALAIGLDQDDTVIRRRLRQKMEFISEELATTEPTDAELQAYLDAHRGKFLEPSATTFEQVYFSTERRGDEARPAAERLLAALQSGRAGADPAAAGDSTLLPPSMEDATPQQVAGTFGEEFVAQLDEVPVGQWSGPLQSPYGLHLVRVVERADGALPTLDRIRPVVLREWQVEQARRVSDEFYEALRGRYDVRVAGAGAARP
ncbi:MAG: peptidyl-prolyl cis-trans isomerase [Lysobacterales bacterium]|jgi:parvulin-like peptidyl-prolyl isomerase|nr:MAG: peptidyl-prolyl cis-trans isomerase [Xanthomonadales bacterium]